LAKAVKLLANGYPISVCVPFVSQVYDGSCGRSSRGSQSQCNLHRVDYKVDIYVTNYDNQIAPSKIKADKGGQRYLYLDLSYLAKADKSENFVTVVILSNW